MTSTNDLPPWGEQLRRWREEHYFSRADLCRNLKLEATKDSNGREISPDEKLVYNWESGRNKRGPQGVYRRALARMGAPLPDSTHICNGPACDADDSARESRPHTSEQTGLDDLPAAISPLDRFRRARALLVDTDKTMGAPTALQGVRTQLRSIDTVRRSANESDGRALAHLQCQFTELAGWLRQDLGEFTKALYCLDRALELSYFAGDPTLTTFVLARKSQLAGDMRDGSTAVLLAKSAAAQSSDRSLTAIARIYEGYGHALIGDTRGVETAYDSARTNAADSSSQPIWGPWPDSSYIDVHRGRSLFALGRYDEAADVFRAAIPTLPQDYYRERGVHLAREALAHARAHDAEAAVAAGLSALTIAQTTGSDRTIAGLRQLDRVLSGENQNSNSAVEFRAALHDARLTV